jgi:hypothetical protein
VAELKVATSIPEADGVIFDHLAEAQLLNGQIADAIDSWRKSAAAYERDKESDKALTVHEKIKVAEAQATEKASVPEPKPGPEPQSEPRSKAEADAGESTGDAGSADEKP